MTRAELERVGEIDRTERIGMTYLQHGTELVARRRAADAPPWDPSGDAGHSVAAQRRALDRWADVGGIALGAFRGERLVGIGMVVPELRPGIAQLAYLHVTHGFRDGGVGSRLADELESTAGRRGAAAIVVSATPSAHTVRFYLGRGYRPMAQPLPELVALEPEDIHLHKPL